MKKLLLILICCATVAISFAQKETYDVIRYHPPSGWAKGAEENLVSFTAVKNNNWCRINIVKSTTSKGDIEQDFENEWKEMVVKNYNSAEEPIVGDAKDAGEWKVKAGVSKFVHDSSDAQVLLLTATGYNRCASIVAVSNSDVFKDDIETFFLGVELLQQDTPLLQTDSTNITSSPQTIGSGTESIIGIWCMSSSDNSSYRVKNGVMSTIFRQYTFKENGTYTCNIKTYDPLMNSTLLGRENGTYKKIGNSLTIIPQRSVLEEWSKKNGADKWGKLLKSQNIAFEKVMYSFSKIYIPENNEVQLILKAKNVTRRDGSFNNYEKNAWVYINSSPSRPIIKLPN